MNAQSKSYGTTLYHYTSHDYIIELASLKNIANKIKVLQVKMGNNVECMCTTDKDVECFTTGYTSIVYVCTCMHVVEL